jgi:uncharacterized membrane protein
MLFNGVRDRDRCVSATVNLWLHLLAFATYAGATVAVLLICLPLARGEDDADRRRQIIVATMRIYDPLTIAALGVLVMTGAFNLTAYKAALQGLFFDRLGTLLAWKLFFTFVLIILAAYIAFGIGHRIVRRADAGEPGDAVWLDRMLARLRTSALLAVLLVAIIAWIALQMTHPGSLPSA